MTWDKIKELVGIVAATSVIVLGIGAAYMEWRIAENVDAALSSQDIGTDAKIVDMDKNIGANTAGVLSNKERAALTQRQLEQVANILMRQPE